MSNANEDNFTPQKRKEPDMSSSDKTIYLLTGDIGGTNSRMGLYDVSSDVPICVKYYRNEEYLVGKESETYEDLIIGPFLKMAWETVDNIKPIQSSEIYACLACAGFVQHNSVKMTNIGNREINGNAIQSNSHSSYLMQIKVCKIINDFVAQGYGCLTLKKDECVELIEGSWDKTLVNTDGPKVCIGAGTGLGQCYLTPDDAGKYNCFGSEGGHVEFNPRSDIEIELRAYLMKKFSSETRISIERIVSGRGLANVFEFLCQKFPDRVDKAVKDEFDNAADQQGKVVAVNAKEGTLAREAIDIMISAYGSEVGSGALKWIPTGGMYVTGGLTPKNIHHIHIPGKESNFVKAFYDKGRLTPLLKEIPLLAVMTEDLGVRGAHYVANQLHLK